jgi:hypothetical protein
MLMQHPRDRLTLFQVMNHPWVLAESSANGYGNGHENLKQAIERMSPPGVDDLSDESSDEDEGESSSCKA